MFGPWDTPEVDIIKFRRCSTVYNRFGKVSRSLCTFEKPLIKFNDKIGPKFGP